MIKRKFFLNFFFIISIFLIDRLTKFLMISNEEKFGETNIQITSFLNLNLIWNEELHLIVFFNEKIYYNFSTILIIFITLIIFWMILKSQKVERLAFMMIFVISG